MNSSDKPNTGMKKPFWTTMGIALLIILVIGGRMYRRYHQKQALQLQQQQQMEWLQKSQDTVDQKLREAELLKARQRRDSLEQVQQELLEAKREQLHTHIKKLELERESD